MALNNFKYNYLMPLNFKGLIVIIGCNIRLDTSHALPNQSLDWCKYSTQAITWLVTVN